MKSIILTAIMLAASIGLQAETIRTSCTSLRCFAWTADRAIMIAGPARPAVPTENRTLDLVDEIWVQLDSSCTGLPADGTETPALARVFEDGHRPRPYRLALGNQAHRQLAGVLEYGLIRFSNREDVTWLVNHLTAKGRVLTIGSEQPFSCQTVTTLLHERVFADLFRGYLIGGGPQRLQ